MNEKWLLCSVCDNKTRLKIREDTVLENTFRFIVQSANRKL